MSEFCLRSGGWGRPTTLEVQHLYYLDPVPLPDMSTMEFIWLLVPHMDIMSICRNVSTCMWTHALGLLSGHSEAQYKLRAWGIEESLSCFTMDIISKIWIARGICSWVTYAIRMMSIPSSCVNVVFCCKDWTLLCCSFYWLLAFYTKIWTSPTTLR